MEDEDFLAAVEADNANEPVTEPAPEPAVETPPAPEVAEQPAPAEQPANPLTPPVVDIKPEPGFVPITAMLDERDKRKAVERELERIRISQAQQTDQVPDRYEDPDGYDAFVESKTETKLLNITLNTSERFARKEHGAEIVDAAKTWVIARFESDPLYQAQILNDPDPYERVVQDYQRDQIASQVKPADFAEFQAWKAAQAALTQQQSAAPAAPTSPAIPPRSLASAPSAGGVNAEVAQSDEEIFAETFTRK